MQDDLRYAFKRLTEPIDVNVSSEEVRSPSLYVTFVYSSPQVIPLMENLPEYKALEDEGRRVAFAKFIQRQKVSSLSILSD